MFLIKSSIIQCFINNFIIFLIEIFDKKISILYNTSKRMLIFIIWKEE